MSDIYQTYRCLLADVAVLSGYSEIRGSCETLQWAINDAPKLEKYILGAIESGQKLDLELFPVWLRRLAASSVVDGEKLRLCRQLLLFCYKASVPLDNIKVQTAYQVFLDTNTAVGSFADSLARESPRDLKAASRHCQSVLFRCRFEEIKPSHGPGKVTTSKRKWMHVYDSIEYLYPFADWFCMQNIQHWSAWDSAERKTYIQAKVAAVPKDSRGPRLICVHPAESIWIQQGVRRELERAISLDRYSKGPWPKNHVFFKDQSVNGQIALKSSQSGAYATLDMKEASDRISDCLLQCLFGRYYKYFGCCRATEFRIPRSSLNREEIKGFLNSYAPMGNATTFPVQSLVFWSICVAVLKRIGFNSPNAVFVFGDDIIVPSKCAEAVIHGLESFGLIVNRTKSFWRGKFRESCGVDAFNGINVTPIRWKSTADVTSLDALQSLSDLAMRLRIAGYEGAAANAYSILRARLQQFCGKRLFETNNRNHGGIAEFVLRDSNVFQSASWLKDVQWFHSRVWRLQECFKENILHDWNHVLESVCLLRRTGKSNIQSRPAPGRVKLTPGWIPVL